MLKILRANRIRLLLGFTISLTLLALMFVPSGGALETGTYPVKRALFENSSYSASTITQVTDLYTSHIELGWKVQSVHKLRPSLVCLVYRNMRAVKTDSPEWQTFVNNRWILKDAYGTLIRSTVYGYYIVDVGNPNYQTWLANWVKNAISQYGYDGVSLDNCLPSTEIMWSTTPGPAINPRTGKAYTALEFEQAVINVVNAIKNTIGTKLVVGNVVYYGQRFFADYANPYYVALLTQSKIDGVQSEAWIMSLDTIEWYSESKWLASIDFAVWLENNFLNKGGKMFLPISQNAAPYERPGEALPSGTTRAQYVNYIFSSLLLGIKTSSSYLNFGYATDSSTQSLFKIDVGDPIGNYYMITGTHVYSRDYSKVKVLVNPTYTSYTISLQTGYKNLDGTAVVSPITVKPHTGIILKNPVTVSPTVQVFLRSGFETGSFSEWSGFSATNGETARVVTTPRYNGNFSARFATTYDSIIARAFCYKYLSAPTELNVSMRVYIGSGLPLRSWEALWLIQLRDSAGYALASYGIKGGQTSTRWTTMVNSTNAFAASGPTVNTWYLLEASYKKSSSGKTVVLRVNDQEVASLSLNTSGTKAINDARVGICYNDAGYASNVYVDDVTITGIKT